MSLKFGIYLVEQRIISPEQFCGLVKIQQEASMSAATVAIRKNLLSIRQIASIMEIQEANKGQSFVEIAQEKNYLERSDVDQLLHFQQLSCPTITSLAIECGLITESQAVVLHRHFAKDRNRQLAPARTATENASPAAERRKVAPRHPKYKQRPVVVHQQTT